VPFHAVDDLRTVSLATVTNGNDRLVFAVSPTRPLATSFVTPWSNFPIATLPADLSSVPPGPWGFLEFGYDAQFNTSYVDSFGLNWSFVDDAAPTVVYGVKPQVARDTIQTAFEKFTTNDPLGADFKDLLWTATTTPPAVIDGQFTAIVAPKDWLVANPQSALDDYWTDTVDDFFAAGNRLSVTFDGTTYAGSSDGNQYMLSGGVILPKSLYDGTVPDQDIWNQLQTDNSPVAGQIKDAVFEAFSRGVSLDGVWPAGRPGVMPEGYSSDAWTNYKNWYVHGPTAYDPSIFRTYDVYAKFFHYSTKDGTDFRDGGTTLLGMNPAGFFAMAYGFSLDESPSVNTAPALKFPGNTWPADATVNGGTTLNGGASATVTFGPWTSATPSAPVVTGIDRSSASPTTASAVQWTVSFNEPVTGVTGDNFRLVSSGLGGTPAITAVTAGSGGAYSQTWTVTATTGTGSGTLGLNMVDGTGVKDKQGVGVAHLPAVGQVYVVRPQGATASIARGAPSPTDAASVPFVVTFSQAVVGLSAANFAVVATGVTGAAITNVTGSGTTWTVNVGTGSGSGTLGLTMSNGVGVNPAVTGLPVIGAVYQIDKNDPTKAPEVSGIGLADANPTSAASVRFTVTFSEPVTGVAAGNFLLAANGPSGARITGVSGSGSTWTVTAGTGTGSGALGLDMVNSTGVVDADGRPVSNLPFTGDAYTVDRTQPHVTSIARLDPTPTSLAAVRYEVAFDEPVSGLSAANFAVAATGLVGATITSVQGGGTAWTVTVLTGSGSGTLRLDMVNSTGVSDAAGHPVTGLPVVGQMYAVQRGSAPIVRAPIAFWVKSGQPGSLVWPRGLAAFSDPDTAVLTATLAVSGGGTLVARSGGGVVVAGGGSELSFTGRVASLVAFFARPGALRYTAVAGDLRPRSLQLTATDGRLSGLTTSAVLVQPRVPAPQPPSIRPATLLGPTARSRPLEISYAQLVIRSGATGTQTRSVQFMLNSVQAGTIEVWNSGRWRPVLPQPFAMPLVAPGGKIRWTPPATASGRVAAFTISTWDGLQRSTPSRVSVTVTA